MLWIDTKYAGLISPKLDKWKVKQTNPFVANFRCPICGDSASNPNKARGYLLQHKNSMMLKCHNCGISMGLDKLIEKLDSSLYQQYKLEKFEKNLRKNLSILNLNLKQKVSKTFQILSKISQI